jgi:hypothetical protein
MKRLCLWPGPQSVQVWLRFILFDYIQPNRAHEITSAAAWKALRSPLLLFFVPLHTILELDARPPEDVQRAPNGEVHLSITQLLDQLQILKRASSSRIRDGNTAPLCQPADELVVDAALEPFDICGVDEELRAVGLKKSYRLYA